MWISLISTYMYPTTVSRFSTQIFHPKFLYLIKWYYHALRCSSQKFGRHYLFFSFTHTPHIQHIIEYSISTSTMCPISICPPFSSSTLVQSFTKTYQLNSTWFLTLSSVLILIFNLRSIKKLEWSTSNIHEVASLCFFTEFRKII